MSLSQTCKYLHNCFKKYLKHNPSQETIYNYLCENNRDMFLKRLSRRCRTCGALFMTILDLKRHLNDFSTHRISRKQLTLKICYPKRVFYMFFPVLSEYQCLYGVCNCLSKKQKFIDEIPWKKIDIEIVTKYGYFCISNIINDGEPTKFPMVKIYEFHSNPGKGFKIFFFREHFWLQLSLTQKCIIPIYEFRVFQVLDNPPIHLPMCGNLLYNLLFKQR